jgi:isoquinoline 1-oxidoreductase beta subunit
MNTPHAPGLSRRSFLKFSALAGGGLLLGLYSKSSLLNAAEVGRPTPATLGDFSPNLFVRISPDGTVTIICHKPEVGQGISTALPMLVAEELDADWTRVKIDNTQFNPAFGNQRAGGSNSTPTSYTPMRQMGATARAMLITAAAQTWGVPATECTTANGFVVHAASNRRADFGSLVAKASTVPVPAANTVALKDPKDFKLVGTRVSGFQNEQIVTGQRLFGIDQKTPGMLHAVYVKCPVFGGKVVSANLDQILALPGVKQAFVLEGTSELNGLMPGVAIVANSTWEAFSARKQLRVTWNEGRHANDSTDEFNRKAAELGAKMSGGTDIRRDGDAAAALAGAAKVVEAAYYYPFLSHATLEPQNTLAHVQGDRAELWSPTRAPNDAVAIVSRILGIPQANITLHIARSGGAFGRRADADFVIEAAAISQKAGVPIKLTWTREQDLQHDHYRQAGHHFFKAGLDAAGKVVAWQNHFVTYGRRTPGRDGGTTLNTGSGGALAATEFPAGLVPNFHTVQSIIECSVPVGPWRAPGANGVAYAMQGFIDELAVAAGADPLKFRLDLINSPAVASADTKADPRGAFSPARARGVLQLAAEKAGWGKKFPKGQGAGIAFHYCFGGYIAYVAEVTVSRGGDVTVDRIVAAADVGRQIVNLSGAEAQIEGAIIDGMSTSLYQEATLEKGRMTKNMFDQYPVLRIPEAPKKIEIHFLCSDNNPTGLGEPPFAPVPPVLANAIFAATGKRLRQMPWTKSDLSWA